MTHARTSTSARLADVPPCHAPPEPAYYAALDLGTNNCRLLIARRAGRGFRIVEAFSKIVRLGEGLSRSGRLEPQAMDRAMAALRVCADKVNRRPFVRLKAVATQACRAAENGEAFVAAVERETGLKLHIISPQEEAGLSVAGCANLIDHDADAALVIDVGGGSTELSWLDLRRAAGTAAPAATGARLEAWLSIPIGVVTLAERFPETSPASAAWFRDMVDHVKAEVAVFPHADGLRPIFRSGDAHLVGTSGAITSLAGLHLGLERYDRSRVDGLWMSRADCSAVADRLIELGPQARAAQPCIGVDRADLVLAGAAILQAVQEVWPCERVRVADRGLREGILMSLIAEREKSSRKPRASTERPSVRFDGSDRGDRA